MVCQQTGFGNKCGYGKRSNRFWDFIKSISCPFSVVAYPFCSDGKNNSFTSGKTLLCPINTTLLLHQFTIVYYFVAVARRQPPVYLIEFENVCTVLCER